MRNPLTAAIRKVFGLDGKSDFTGGITPYVDSPLPQFVWDQTGKDLREGVPSSTTNRSTGYFAGHPEPNIDYRGRGGPGEVAQAIGNVGDVTMRNKQMAGFLSMPAQPGDLAARPGFEVDFPLNQGYESSLPNLLGEDYVGLTVQNRGSHGRIVSQDIPEFANDPAGIWDLISQPSKLKQHRLDAQDTMDEIVSRLNLDRALQARPTQNRTMVMSKGEEGGYQPFASPEAMMGEQTLEEQLIRNYFERTGRRGPGPVFR